MDGNTNSERDSKMGKIDIIKIRYVVTLLYGVALTASFAGLLKRKRNIIKIALLTMSLLLLQVLLILTIGMDLTLYLYPLHTHVVLIAALVIVFGCKLFNAILHTMLAYMCCQIPAWISKLTMYFSMDNQVEFVCYLIAALLILWLLLRYAGDEVYEMSQTSTATVAAFSIVPLTYYFFDYCTTVWTKILYTGNYHVTQFMPSVICVAYLVFSIVYGREQEKRVRANEEKAIVENELQIVQKEIENLGKVEHMTRIYRHDMRHHLLLILHLIEENHIDDVKEYISDNIKNIDSFTPRRFCDMEMLNLLLSHFASLAEEQKIRYQFDVRLPQDTPLNKTEICALVSNALENAFHAVEELPEGKRYVDLKFCEFKRKLIFSVDNSCEAKITMIKSRPQASSKGHGYGTRSICSIANDHGGTATFHMEDGMFSLMVMIPI